MKNLILTFLTITAAQTAFAGGLVATCTGAMYSKFRIEIVTFYDDLYIKSGSFSSFSKNYDLTEGFEVHKFQNDEGVYFYISSDLCEVKESLCFKLMGSEVKIISGDRNYDGLKLRCDRSDLS